MRKKSLVYSGFILLVLTIFLLGYFFYFIPANKRTINSNGFLILKTIASNIKDKCEGHATYYTNIIKEANIDSIDKKFKTIDKKLKDDGIIAKVQSFELPAGKDSPIAGINIEDNNFFYYIKKKNRNKDSVKTLVFTETLFDFLQPVLVTQKDELFKSYALSRIEGKNARLLYHDPDLGIRSDVSDSLLPKDVQQYLTGIRDITSQNFNHKMFFYPFEVNNIQLVIYGFVETDEYNANLRKVPFKFLYPLAIAFLLLLVFLPVLKFYIMDSNEHVQVSDLIMFGLSVFMGGALLTLVIIQYLLWQGEEDRVEGNLKNLSAQIKSSFLGEIEKSYTSIESIDSLKRNDKILQAKDTNYSEQVRCFARSRDSASYYYFDRLSWINDSGNQVLKAEMTGKPVFTNVKERKYFQAFQDNSAYVLPGDSGKLRRFGWEALYSWTNAEFNITISKKAPDSSIVAMATKMYSVVNVLLPVGYGFCIIDADGNVQLHSNVNRNLRENLFEKTAPSFGLRGLVTSRQQGMVNDIAMYGKWHMMHVRPINNLPYSVVTFYDKGFIVPVNMRILIFAVLFYLLSVLICAVLWAYLAKGGSGDFALLKSPMNSLRWITPQRKDAVYYVHALLFLIAYVILFLIFVALYKSYSISNYTILALVILTPVNVIFVLFSIRVAGKKYNGDVEKEQQILMRRKVFQIGIVHIIISVVLFLYSQKFKYPIDGIFFAFQAIFNGCIWLYYSLNKRIFILHPEKLLDYQKWYNWMATILVICLSVLPSSLFTWYAHNQEIIQAVKKQQLYLASDIYQRSAALLNKPAFKDNSLVPPHYIKPLLLQKGIYTINDDVINEEQDTAFEEPGKASYEQFYFNIAEKVSNSYYDPRLLPALEDYAADSTWRWELRDSLIHFWYHYPLRGYTSENITRSSLHVISVTPPRFLFLKLQNLLLLGFLGLLVLALNKWLGINVEQVFLSKYLYTAGKNNELIKKDPIEDYYAQASVKRTKDDEKLFSRSEYEKYVTTTDGKLLKEYEKEILVSVRAGSALYDYIWQHLPEKEKYLVYSFAINGLVNYKNTAEVYDLLAKGIMVINNERLRFFSPVFRAYLVLKKESEEIVQLQKKYMQNSTWQSLRGPLILLLAGFATLIFFTQEAAFQKILALAGGVGTLISIIPKLLANFSNKQQKLVE